MLLLIPGPVTTHPDVRAALATDVAPWDNDFRAVYARVRDRVLRLAGGRAGEHATLVLQGCGHFMVEAALRSFIPRGGRVLIPMTGDYAERMARLAREAGRPPLELPVPENARVQPEAVAAALRDHPDITHVSVVYSETSSGIIHDVPAIARLAGGLGRRVLVDAVSAMGALPLDLGALPMIDAAIFTSNKCIAGAPGLGFSVARTEPLVQHPGLAESWSFDLADIYTHALRHGWGSFRFTPPAQSVIAFDKALDLYEAEGRAARLARYTANMRALYDGVRALGLRPCLPPDLQGPIVVNVHAPADPAWDLQGFVDALKRRGVLISNFSCTSFPSFRVGCIGAITPDDMRRAVSAMAAALDEIGVRNREAA